MKGKKCVHEVNVGRTKKTMQCNESKTEINVNVNDRMSNDQLSSSNSKFEMNFVLGF
jgi:hypothetical protein